MSISNLQKSEIFANVDGNRIASTRQLYAVGKHFGKLHGETPTESFRLSNVFSAILQKFQAEHAETPITHADVGRFFEADEVPQKFLKMLKTKRVVKNTPKPVKAKKAKAVIKDTPKPKAAKKIQADASELKEFQARFDAITKRQDETDKKLATFEAKLDIIMAYLETDPDA